MKILLVNSITVFDRYEIHNGTLLLGTMLRRAGWDVEIIDFNYLCLSGQMSYRENRDADFQPFARWMAGRQPDVVGFSTIANFYVESVMAARWVKELLPAVPIVFGGPHATVTAEDTLNAFPWVDCVCLGEGEHTIVELAGRLARGQSVCDLAGVAYRGQGSVVVTPPGEMSNLDELPFLDYSLIADHIPYMRFLNFEEGRGCPFHCTFCLTQEFWQRRFRMKSAGRIVEEIKYIQAEMARYSDQPFLFNFCHDNFTSNKALVFDICDRLEAEGVALEFTVSSRLDTIDEQTVARLARAGCKKIFFGIESGSERIQHQIRKNLNLGDFDAVLSWIKKYGLGSSLSFIYGFEDETQEDMAASLGLMARAMRMDIPVLYYNLSVFPGTELYRQVGDKLYLDPAEVIGCGFDTLIPKLGDDWRMELIRSHRSIFSCFYSFPKRYLGAYGDMMYFIAYIVDEYKRLAQASFKLMLTAYHDDLLAVYRDFKAVCPDINGRFGIYDNLVFEDGTMMEGYERRVWESLEAFVTATDFPEYDDLIKPLFAFRRDVEAFRGGTEPARVLEYPVDVLALDGRNDNMDREIRLEEAFLKPVRLELARGSAEASRDGYGFGTLTLVSLTGGPGVTVCRLGEGEGRLP